MKEEEKVKKEVKIINKCCGGSPGGGAFYGLGFVGALIYFLQHSETFMEGVMGLLKAIVWPVLLIYSVLELLKF